MTRFATMVAGFFAIEGETACAIDLIGAVQRDRGFFLATANDGRMALAGWLAEAGDGSARRDNGVQRAIDLAAAIGDDVATRLLSGEMLPIGDIAFAIARVTAGAVPPGSWDRGATPIPHQFEPEAGPHPVPAPAEAGVLSPLAAPASTPSDERVTISRETGIACDLYAITIGSIQLWLPEHIAVALCARLGTELGLHDADDVAGLAA